MASTVHESVLGGNLWLYVLSGRMRLILGKLDAPNRVEAAAIAHRLTPPA